MSVAETGQRTLYDTFVGPTLDSALWQPLVLPTPDGTPWVFAEPGADIRVEAGSVVVSVPRFTRSHNELQSPDNAKHFLISTSSVATPTSGQITFSVEMAAEKIRGAANDYRDGFATFNVFDMESGMVFDLVSTGTRILAIYERLPVAGVSEEDAFTYVVDAPLAGVPTTPGTFHQYAITIDAQTGVVRFVVDGTLVYSIPSIPVMPRQLNLGMGLMTLSPISAGSTTSIHGQGMIAQWRRFEYGPGGA
ncbi:DUF6081 family protein [Rhodococcus sp. NPDC059968]|uniref:DUF6081 family protein n=1 Tax=Rhodococcus sp. NPDC059968 TaxID=3347017 RepID=UPI00366B06D6